MLTSIKKELGVLIWHWLNADLILYNLFTQESIINLMGFSIFEIPNRLIRNQLTKDQIVNNFIRKQQFYCCFAFFSTPYFFYKLYSVLIIDTE